MKKEEFQRLIGGGALETDFAGKADYAAKLLNEALAKFAESNTPQDMTELTTAVKNLAEVNARVLEAYHQLLQQQTQLLQKISDVRPELPPIEVNPQLEMPQQRRRYFVNFGYDESGDNITTADMVVVPDETQH